MPKQLKGGGKPIQKIEINMDLPTEQDKKIIQTLKTRFAQNLYLHPSIKWSDVEAKLNANPKKVASLSAMEATGGEPDVVGYDKNSDEYNFYDCSEESPIGRRNTCYDLDGQQEREKKGVYPAGSAAGLAQEMGIKLLNEEQYRHLQSLGSFDLKTSSWIETPVEIRELGGALFADRRFGTVFIYHNTAPSFYSARGFRGVLRV